jgi:hypothetical protein
MMAIILSYRLTDMKLRRRFVKWISSSIINISVSVGISPSSKNIYSLNGKLIRQLTHVEFPYTCELPDCTSGIYIFSLIAENFPTRT